MLTVLSKNDTYIYASSFSQKTGFDISCKLSLEETVCMKCQTLFPEKKNQKNSGKYNLLKILPSMLSVKTVHYTFNSQ